MDGVMVGVTLNVGVTEGEVDIVGVTVGVALFEDVTEMLGVLLGVEEGGINSKLLPEATTPWPQQRAALLSSITQVLSIPADTDRILEATTPDGDDKSAKSPVPN